MLSLSKHEAFAKDLVLSLSKDEGQSMSRRPRLRTPRLDRAAPRGVKARASRRGTPALHLACPPPRAHFKQETAALDRFR